MGHSRVSSSKQYGKDHLCIRSDVYVCAESYGTFDYGEAGKQRRSRLRLSSLAEVFNIDHVGGCTPSGYTENAGVDSGVSCIKTRSGI